MKVKLLILLCVLATLVIQVRRQGCVGGFYEGRYGYEGEDTGQDSVRLSEPKYEIPILVAIDPNDIIGPKGYGENRWISPGQLFDGTIRIKNDLIFATAPVQLLTTKHSFESIFDFRCLSAMHFEDAILSKLLISPLFDQILIKNVLASPLAL